MNETIQLSCWMYRRLLFMYPRELRERFSMQMVEIFEDLLLDAATRRGVRGMVPVGCQALWELLSVGLLLRMQTTEAIAGVLSLFISSVIAWGLFRAVG
jgi:hypothetical protein